MTHTDYAEYDQYCFDPCHELWPCAYHAALHRAVYTLGYVMPSAYEYARRVALADLDTRNDV